MVLETYVDRGDGAAAAAAAARRKGVCAVKRVRRMPTEIYRDPRHLSVAELRRRLGPKARACSGAGGTSRKARGPFYCCAICSEAWVGYLPTAFYPDAASLPRRVLAG